MARKPRVDPTEAVRCVACSSAKTRGDDVVLILVGAAMRCRENLLLIVDDFCTKHVTELAGLIAGGTGLERLEEHLSEAGPRKGGARARVRGS